ncbi:MAG: dihydroorotate dehydrogenase [Candidatus Omnitrophica bacterium]|nr:dihydroorotate dehydrogenase [Candidatus Omnitrophota bacterium]MDD5652628.1 dihydroorotate dehydrogenase [Candidatus Omnitrophota bacterium]
MKNPDLSVKIGKLKLKNPVMVASGTFGYAEEFSGLVGLHKLGAVVSKTITLKGRPGNTLPRTCETPAGMLNSIGLENPGINKFIKEKLPVLRRAKAPIIVSIASENDPQEFVVLANELEKIRDVAAIELNISCPNVKTQKSLISQDPEATFQVVKAVRKVSTKTLITKLSPNVTDITQIALAAQNAGSDAVSLINTLLGMSIDVKARKPKIASITAGLSGPAIRPIAVRMVWEAFQKIKIPIIGMGGIIDASSALEFFLAGASAVAVGTANFIDPKISNTIIEGIRSYLKENRVSHLEDIVGALKA